MKCILEGQRINQDKLSDDVKKIIANKANVNNEYYGGDIDELKSSGVWVCVNASGTLPPDFSNWFSLAVFPGGTGSAIQIASLSIGQNQTNRTCIRHYNGVWWDAWAALATNDELYNPNLLDNWYFINPINQRNITETSGGNIYIIDRWSTSGSTGANFKLEEDGMLITSPDVYGAYLAQTIDPEIVKQLRGKEVTYSALFKDNSALVNLSIYFSGQWVDGTSVNNGLVYKTITVPTDTTGITISFGANGAGNSKIEAVKLELGNRSTLAHYNKSNQLILNDPPPNRSLELAKCQRYYECGASPFSLVIPAYGNIFLTGTQFATTKRVTPTIFIYNEAGHGRQLNKVNNLNGIISNSNVIEVFSSINGITGLKMSDALEPADSYAYYWEATADI